MEAKMSSVSNSSNSEGDSSTSLSSSGTSLCSSSTSLSSSEGYPCWRELKQYQVICSEKEGRIVIYMANEDAKGKVLTMISAMNRRAKME